MVRPGARWLAGALCLAGALGSACGGGGQAPATPAAPRPPPAPAVAFGFTDLEEGNGPPVEDGWLLAIAYTGWLYDAAAPDNRGREFAAATAEAPFPFRLGAGQVIAGVDRGVPGMRVGGRRQIVIPPELGFGAQGSSLVPPNAALLFEVEIVAGAEVPFTTSDLRLGDGAEATNGRSLSVAYQGWVFDLTAEGNRGDLFDSTTADAPFRFTLGVGNVIAGWDLGVPGMRVGGLRRLVIPHELAYGTQGRPPRIPRFATLLFEVELLAVE